MKGIFCKDVLDENKELKQKLEALEREKQEALRRYEELFMKSQKLESKVSELERENSNLRANASNLESKASMLEREKQELSKKVSELEKEKQELASKASELERENSNLRANVSNLESKISMLEREKQELSKKYEDELKALKEENQSYRTKFEVIEKEKDNLMSKLENLQKDLEKFKARAKLGFDLLEALQSEGVFVVTPDFKPGKEGNELVYINKRGIEILKKNGELMNKTYGYNIDWSNPLGISIHKFHKDPERIKELFKALKPGEVLKNTDIQMGNTIIESYRTAIYDENGNVINYASVWKDATYERMVDDILYNTTPLTAKLYHAISLLETYRYRVGI